jgi:hypothetical protein
MDNKKNEWLFRYRAYKKQRKIQLKPYHDKEKHFSIVWCKEKNEISLEEFEYMDNKIRELMKEKNNQLQFRIIKPTTNCTYGRFDADFEDLIKDFRKKYKLCREKDLPLNHVEHQHLKSEELWDDLNPIFFHIHTKDESDIVWQDLMRNSPKDSIISCNIEMLKTE